MVRKPGSRKSTPRRVLGWLLVLGPLVFGALFARDAAAGEVAEPRLALVIGNAGYRDGRLPTAAQDAGLVAQSLAHAGYDVTAMADVDAAAWQKTVGLFAGKVRAAGDRVSVFVYLSGYGLQFEGDNFFVPVDAVIPRQADVPNVASALSGLQQTLEALPARGRVFVYDLARETPFAKRDTAKPDALPLAAGLSLVRAPPGSLYAFNAAPGMAARSDTPPYGLYARALAETLRTPGLTGQAMLARVRLRVASITGCAVVPWDDSGLDADFAIVPAGATPIVRADSGSIQGRGAETAFWAAISADRLDSYRSFERAFPGSRLSKRLKTMAAVRLEAATWGESVRAKTSAALWTYMQRYPRGPHYVDVRRRLAALHTFLEPPSRFEPYDFAPLPLPSPDQLQAVDRPPLTFEDPEGVPLPRVPEEILPPQPAAIDFELPPPPLVPEGVLPIPAWDEMSGRIVQPVVPGLGVVAVEDDATGGGAMVLSVDDEPVTRTIAQVEAGMRTIVETDAADEVLSRTLVTRADGPLITIAQTDGGGRRLSTIVTRIDALGERTTTVSDGQGGLVAEIRTNRWGVETDVTRGSASLGAATFEMPRSDPPPQSRPPEAAVRPGPSPAAPAQPAAPPPIAMPVPPPSLPAAPSRSAEEPGAKPKVEQAPAAPPISDVAPPRPAPPRIAPAASSAGVPMPVPRPHVKAPGPRHRAAHGRQK